MKKDIHPDYHEIEVVMTDGSVLVEGNIEEIKKNEKVIEAYLGRDDNQ